MKQGDVGIVRYSFEDPSGEERSYEYRVRILMVKDGLTFIEQWFETHWELYRRRTFGYAKYSTDWFVQHFELLAHEPLTAREISLHRTDLPITAFNLPTYHPQSVADSSLESYSNFRDSMGDFLDELSSFPSLRAESLYIVAPNSGLGVHKSQLVSPIERGEFSATELVWRSTKYLRELGIVLKCEGLGLNQLGVKSSLPWYLLGLSLIHI